jgi:outer membrane protein assembly factor BamB
LVGELILLMAENGEVLLIAPSPEDEKIVARFRALSSKTWNPPALAGEYLLVRNDVEAVCFKLPFKPR